MSKEKRDTCVTAAIANQKGGVAKTTTAINVGAYFAEKGHHVLIVDQDGQGQVATGLGKAKENGLYRFVVEGQPIHKSIIRARANLDVIANDHTCELVKDYFRKASFKEFILPELLGEAINQEHYDLVLLDAPPSTDEMHVLALVAADMLLVPSSMDYYGLDGVNEILKTVNRLGRFPNVVPPTLIGVLPVRFKRQTSEAQAMLESLVNDLGEKLVLPPIPEDTKVPEAVSRGATIWEYAPNTRALIGYDGATTEKNSLGNWGGYLHVCELMNTMLSSQFEKKE
jgi:chromosome partitioning protein